MTEGESPRPARVLARVVVAPLVLPHELAHAVVARLAGLDPTVEVLPQWDGTAVPLGRFDATLDETTPPAVVRAVAVAPLPVYLLGTVAVRLAVDPEGIAVVPLVCILAYSASLSGGDLAVCAAPSAACDAGAFLVPPSRWQALAVVIAPLTALTVAALLLV